MVIWLGSKSRPKMDGNNFLLKTFTKVTLTREGVVETGVNLNSYLQLTYSACLGLWE